MKKLKLIIPVVLLSVSVACFAAACGETVAPEAHTHTFSTAWSHDDTYHWHASNCDHSEKTSDKAAHTFTEEVVEPSCTQAGYTLHACECGYSYTTDEQGEALGHIMVNYAAREATCSLDGWDAYSACARCGYEEGVHETYAATGNHSIVPHNGQPATHYEDGWKPYETCSTCGEYDTFEAISSDTVHVYDGNVCAVCEHEYALSQKLTFSESGSTCSVTGIGEYTGAELRIPKTHNGKTVTSIASGAFKGNETITKVLIPGTVLTVGSEAFYGCKNLKEVAFTSDGTTTLGIATFSGCASLEEITLPATLTTIKEFTFQGCASLGEIVLPEELETIGYQTFKDCTSLTEITIPKKIALLDYNLFMNCTALESVTFAGDKVANIKWQAFYGCTALTEITLPAALEEIGQSAFEKTGLTSIVLPNNLAYIATRAFKDCALTSATFQTASGWMIAAKTALNGEYLAVPEQAAELLTGLYVNEFWKRG